MTTFDLTRGTRVRALRRHNLLLVVALLVACALVVHVVTDRDGSAESLQLGPTVVAEARDLATTLEASGSLQRSSEHTVAYAGALSSDDGTAVPDGSGDDGNDGGSDPLSFTRPTSTTSSSSTSSTSSSSTTNPCSPSSTSSKSPSSSSTTTTSPCSTTTSTSSTTAPPPASTTTTTITTTTQPEPGDDGDPAAPPSPGDGVSPGAGNAAPSNGGGDPSAAPGSGNGAPGDGDEGGEVPSATLTGVIDVGAPAGRGTVLYTADEQPVVALIGDLPAWRTLEDGVHDGADVRQLEENLVALGYGAGLDVDETFTADTATAVEAWETDLGRDTPDGTVTIGDVVFLTTPGDVLGHEAAVGDTLQAGSPVLTIGSEQRIVVADVDATSAGGWAPGSNVELEWADGATTTGTVFGTGKHLIDGQVELIVAVEAGDTGAGNRRRGAEAAVTPVDATRDDVIAVPVAAIVEDGDAIAVRVERGDGLDEIVPVETGLVADGWIEITVGLDGGEKVRIPG